MTPLKPLTRILVAVASLAMIAGYFIPMWEILLWAPQYTEGLSMHIWLDHLSGDVEIINGLNHYIGMAEIHEELFPEFGYLKYVLGVLVLIGLTPAVFGKRIWLQVFVAILFVCAALGLYDFWKWGYDYGHNLDPKAAISVPGMTYSPPIIGYKSLLNFVAYSGPHAGGWVLIVSGVVSTILLMLEMFGAKFFGRKKPSRQDATGSPEHSGLGTAALLLFLVPASLLSSCGDLQPVAITYGKDGCESCKMILMDERYGTEFVTDKGKVFKFDDVNCMLNFLKEKGDLAGQAYIIDFEKANQFLPVDEAVYLKHEQLRSPMRSNIAAFVNSEAAKKIAASLEGEGEILQWNKVSG